MPKADARRRVLLRLALSICGGLGLAWAGDGRTEAPSAAPGAERARLMREGESALAGGQVDVALQRFERAALVEHAADIEMAIVRTHMQAGNYRQALAFSAHTAGAHRQVPEGAALYAWLLAVGGQSAAALRLLDEADQRFADHAVLDTTRQLIRTPGAEPAAGPTGAPAWLRPYGALRVRTPARVVASGVLIDAGQRALVPASAVAGSAPALQVRNGLGLGAVARVEQRLPALGLVVLKLERRLQARSLSRALGDGGTDLPLPAPAARDPFPGSPGYAVTFASPRSQAPAWPRLHVGFHGMPAGPGGQRLLGIDTPPGPRGGPVFDAAGHWAGVAVTQADGAAHLVSVSRLKQALGRTLGTEAATAPAQRASIDEIYEAALRSTVQVIIGT